ncbi:hypothetical protein DXG03_007804 [Asterophora parasitica]|uniref:Uncharacterized protein n=1 Tax=Asterophora parasitica TaxID=117018 RepID=A0A9P7KGK3_9AGAR|nr:hypothetical protein DXG03_007804 [Asterophora parasitica]
MHVFYPDNVPRADRLQQLINNIGVIQTDISREKKRQDELDAQTKTKLDELLAAGKIESLAELEKKALSKLTDEEKAEYDALIKSTKLVAQVTETMLWAGLLLGGNKLISLGGKVVMALVRGIAAIQAVRVAVTAFVETISGLAKGGAAVAKALASAASKARQAADAAKKATGFTKIEGRVSRVFRFLGKIGKWLSWFGVVLVAAAPLVELFVGANQKEELIKGIHETQVTRLVVDTLKQQARNITEQMNSTNMYLSMLHKGKKASAEAVAEEMLDTIKEQDEKIDLDALEDDLRIADKSTLAFYGKDDLEKSIVVERAKTERAEDEEKRLKELAEKEKAG